MSFYPSIEAFIQDVENAQSSIGEQRVNQLDQLAQSIRGLDAVSLVFICTHNSRRSHYAQIWAQVASSYYNMPRITAYSGGTEVTALNERVIDSLKRVGFRIEGQDVANPRYLLKYSDNHPSITAFSKKYDHFVNPQSGFIALMTCSDADTHCPVVEGADSRFLLKYEDPKVSDDTADEAKVYSERCFQIATEIFYLFRSIKKK